MLSCPVSKRILVDEVPIWNPSSPNTMTNHRFWQSISDTVNESNSIASRLPEQSQLPQPLTIMSSVIIPSETTALSSHRSRKHPRQPSRWHSGSVTTQLASQLGPADRHYLRDSHSPSRTGVSRALWPLPSRAPLPAPPIVVSAANRRDYSLTARHTMAAGMRRGRRGGDNSGAQPATGAAPGPTG